MARIDKDFFASGSNTDSASGLALELDCGPDPALLQEVVGHLLDNALEFVDPKVLPCVQVWSESGPTMDRVYVGDNGIGIPAEHQQRIFGLFQRLNNEHPGSGVGLAIVRKAVERMGGQSGVESVPGKGSRFLFELPKPG